MAKKLIVIRPVFADILSHHSMYTWRHLWMSPVSPMSPQYKWNKNVSQTLVTHLNSLKSFVWFMTPSLPKRNRPNKRERAESRPNERGTPMPSTWPHPMTSSSRTHRSFLRRKVMEVGGRQLPWSWRTVTRWGPWVRSSPARYRNRFQSIFLFCWKAIFFLLFYPSFIFISPLLIFNSNFVFLLKLIGNN